MGQQWLELYCEHQPHGARLEAHDQQTARRPTATLDAEVIAPP